MSKMSAEQDWVKSLFLRCPMGGSVCLRTAGVARTKSRAGRARHFGLIVMVDLGATFLYVREVL